MKAQALLMRLHIKTLADGNFYYLYMVLYTLKIMANKKITLEFTPTQLNALLGLRDDTESAIGGTDIDVYLKNQVRLIDRMLKANGYKRQ